MELLVKYKNKEIAVPRVMIDLAEKDLLEYVASNGSSEDYHLDSGYDAILHINYDNGFDNTALYQWFRDNDIEYDRNLAILLATAAVHYVHGVKIIER